MPKKLCLVDGSNHAFRMFHAMPRLTAGGRHTGALLGFANLLRMLERDESPDYTAVIFDKGPSFRVKLLPEYKGHRPEMPPELAEQWPQIPTLVEAWGIRQLALDGFEADDIIATLARRYAGPELDVVVVSGDKDFLQLVSDHVRILDLKSGQRREIGPREVEERFGIGPDRVVDILALWGDTSDNVPGVKGIGEKKAAALVKQFGDLDTLLARSNEVKGKMGENLRSSEDQVRLSRELVTLRDDLTLPFDLDDLARRPPDEERLRPLLVELQFRQHLEELEARTGPALSVTDGGRYKLVNRDADLRRVVAACRQSGRFAVDTATTSREALDARLVGCSLCWGEDEAVYIPFGHTAGDQLPREAVMEALATLFEDESLQKVGQNLKYDLQVLMGEGVRLRGIAGDTMLADYLLESGRESHKLDDMAMRLLGRRTISYSEITEGLPPGSTFADVSLEEATAYAAEQVHVTWLLDARMEPRLREEGLHDLYREVELPLVPVLADMERAGIGLDVPRLGEVSEELGERIEELERDIHGMAGHSFNISSPAQLARVLFDEQGFKVHRKTRLTSARSTDARTLEALAAATPENPLPASVLEYRSLTKLKGTYLDVLPVWVKEDGRLHTSFHQAVAATGRLASSDPNLQNIPVRTELGRRIRACFVPAEGHLFLSADYSQVELRILAHYSQAGPLVEAFSRGEDIHTRTAAEIFGVTPELVSPDQRRAAKAINFGIIYGMGAHRLSRELMIPYRKAQGFIDAYFSRYPGVRACLDGVVEDARARGYATTLMGRRRMVPDLKAHVRHVREAAERVAMNTPLQGTAADIIKVAMNRVWRRLKRDHPGARLLLQVHDELLLEVPAAALQDVRAAVVEEMEAVGGLRVPLRVDTGAGRSWDEAH